MLIFIALQQRCCVDGSELSARFLHGSRVNSISHGHLPELAGNVGNVWWYPRALPRIQLDHRVRICLFIYDTSPL